MAHDPTLRQLLAVPYRIEAQTTETAPDVWVRRAAYPELEECQAEAATIEETLALLEHRRIEVIVAMLRSGRVPPMPRPPLGDCDPVGLLQRHGGHGDLVALLDRSASHWPRA